jgi:Carboxypeptidase regulatory-like domain
VSIVSVERNGATGTSTATDGTYTVSGLPSGAYRVSFSAPGYLAQYYKDAVSAGSATQIKLASGATVTGIDGHLQLAGAISGTVTDGGGTPIADIFVTVFDAAGQVGSAQTAADGTYSVGSLPAGAYSVKFAPSAPVAGFSPGGGNYLPQFYNGESSSQNADSVTVVDGRITTGIDAHLPPGGTISGQVLDQTNAVVEGMLVTAYAASGEVAGSWFTEPDGRYSIDQLQSGSYALGFSSVQANSVPNDLPQFYAARRTLAGANAVVVTAGSDTEINEHVTAGGQVTGTVTGPDGHSVERARVLLLDALGDDVAEAQTGTTGSYTIDGLVSGSYFAEFSPPLPLPPIFGGGGNFLPTFFNGESSLANANPVHVTLGATTAGINGTLAEGGELKGTVTGAGSATLANVTVIAYNATGNSVASTLTESNGTYTLGGLNSGSYRVRFEVEAGNPFYASPGDYAPQFDGGVSSLAAAEAVPVGAGASASVVNAQLQPGATISGAVTGLEGDNVSGERVTAYDESGASAGSATSAADGSYTIADLGGGSYRVGFEEEASAPGQPNYAPQFFESEPNLAAARAVSVPAGEGVSGINAQLTVRDGGAIAGEVTDASGNPLAGEVKVDVYDESGQDVASGRVEPNGTYLVGALAEGTYRMSFESFGSGEGYSKQFFGGTSLASASGVLVTAGATTPNVNVQLNRAGGAIAGTVTDDAGCGIGAQVTAYDASGSPIASTTTMTDGSYAVPDLAPGFYRLGFTASGCTSDFYGGAATLAQAVGILVVSKTTAEGIDEQLMPVVGPGMATPRSTSTTPASSTTTSAKSGVAGGRVVVPPKPLTRAQKLAKALVNCKKLKRSKRGKCVAAAKRRYPLKKPKAKAKAKHKVKKGKGK